MLLRWIRETLSSFGAPSAVPHRASSESRSSSIRALHIERRRRRKNPKPTEPEGTRGQILVCIATHRVAPRLRAEAHWGPSPALSIQARHVREVRFALQDIPMIRQRPANTKKTLIAKLKAMHPDAGARKICGLIDDRIDATPLSRRGALGPLEP